MKKLLYISLLFCTFTINAQVNVKGIITEQNSGNKPIVGVQIKALGLIAPEVTDNAGFFLLQFNAKKAGDKILGIGISKKGYEIVNQKEISNWIISNNTDDRTKIIMCPEGLLAENTAKYYDISFKAATEGYNKRIKELQLQKDKALIDVKTYNEQFNLLNEQYTNQQNQLEELADKFARENFDDCSEVQKQAFEAFKLGNVNEAIRILETVNSVEEIERAKLQKEKGKALENEGKDMQAQADSVIQQNITKLIYQADLYTATFRFAEAEKAYEDAANADTTNSDNTFAFANFLSKQNQHKNSIKWYNTALSYVKSDYDKAITLNNLAMVQIYMNQFNEAMENIENALEILNLLFDDNTNSNINLSDLIKTSIAVIANSANIEDLTGNKKSAEDRYIELLNLIKSNDNVFEYRSSSALIFNLLAVLQRELNKYKEAEKNNIEAINIYRKLAKEDPKIYNSELASAINNLALLQRFQQQYDKSEQNFKESIAICRILVKENPDAYKNMLAKILSNFGILQHDINHYNDADSCFTEALNIYKNLAKENPQAYDNDLAMTLNNLAMLQYSKKEFLKAKDNLKNSLLLYESLANDNPQSYNYWVALVKGNLGLVQTDLQDYPNAEKNLLESVNIFRELINKNSGFYDADLVLAMNNLGAVQLRLQKYDSSEITYNEVLKIYAKLTRENPEVYNSSIAKTYNNIGTLLTETKKYSKAEPNYIHSLKSYKELARTNPQTYNSMVALVQANLGRLYYNLNQFDTSLEYFSEALNFYRILAKENPKIYNTELAYVLFYLSLLQTEAKNYEKAEIFSIEAVNIFRILASENPKFFKLEFARQLNALGIMQYSKLKHYDNALNNFTESVEVFESLVNENPQAYNYELAVEYMNLANLQKELGQFDEAENNYSKAIAIYRILANESPQDYNLLFARLLNELAVAQYDIFKHYDKAELNYKESIDVFKSLTEELPKTYDIELATVYTNLALLQKEKMQYEDAANTYTEALKIYRILANESPQDYKFLFARKLNELAVLQYDVFKHYDKAEQNLKESIDVFKSLTKELPNTYAPELATVYTNLALLQKEKMQYEDAVNSYTEALTIYKIMPKDYIQNIATTLNDIAWLQYKANLPKAIENTTIAIDIYMSLIDSLPDLKSDLAVCQARVARYQLLNKQFVVAEKYAKQAIAYDNTNKYYNKNLAHCYLYQNKYIDAERIYSKLENDEVMRVAILSDFDEFEKVGVTHPDVNKIRKLLNE